MTTLLFTVSAFAHEHTALNGTWTLVPAQSDFGGQPVIQTGTVTINERDGDITVSRSFKYQGANDTFFYRDLNEPLRKMFCAVPRRDLGCGLFGGRANHSRGRRCDRRWHIEPALPKFDDYAAESFLFEGVMRFMFFCKPGGEKDQR